MATREQAPSSTPAGAAAATALPPGAVAAAVAAAGVGGVAGVGLTAAQIAQTAGRLSAALLKFEAGAFGEATAATIAVLATRYPEKRRAELESLLSIEEKFEREFRRKMKARLDRDLPKALSITDPTDREAAVRQIMDREKRYSLQREEAMLQRALGKMEAQILEQLSPEGAFWKLSPHVKQHTLDCLAMGNKFWPWSVLKRIQPPLHAGCPCYLLGLDEAIAAGLMAKDLVPDPEDAERRYAQLKKSVEDLEDRDDLQEAVELVFAEIAARDLPLEEARRRIPLRWHKGFSKGGEFRPTRGGVPGTRVIKALLGDGSTPVRARDARHGRWAWVRGTYTRIPEQSRWERRSGGSRYHSPPGSTVVYRDGHPISSPGERVSRRERRSAGTAKVVRDERIESLAEQIRAEARSVSRERGGVERGDGATELLSLLDQGFKLERTKGSGQRMMLTYRAPAGELLDVAFNGEEVTDVAWGGVPVSKREAIGGRSPKDWNEFASDALAWADELGRRFDADVHVPQIRASADLPDHAGTHAWSGEAEVGIETQLDIDRAAKARQEMRSLTNDQMRGVYSAYWVTSHEIAHGVNPIPFEAFNGADANLEEALTEELAHQLAVERLTEQNQMDVVDWAATHPSALAVRGTYQEARDTLGRLIEKAGVIDPHEKRALIEELKFKVDPTTRIDILTSLIHKQFPNAKLDEVRLDVEAEMKTPTSFGEKPELLRTDVSPGMAQVGRGEYGKLAAGTLSADGKTLAGLPDGSRRTIEKLPMLEGFPELEAMTDGTAIVKYGPNERDAEGLTYRDGRPKSFRYIDNEERAKLILRALAGKGSPGVAYEPDESRLRALRAEGLSDVEAKLAMYREDTKELVLKRTPSIPRQTNGFRFPPPITDHGSTAGDDAPNTEVSLTPRSYEQYLEARAAQKKRLGKLSPGTVSFGEDDKGFADSQPTAAELLLPDPPQNPGTWLPWFRKPKKGEPPKEIFADKPKPVKPKPPEYIGGKKGVKQEGPIPNYDGVKLKLGKGAGGSNGARWAFDKDDNRWLLKTYRGDQDRIANEILANRVYATLGARVADAGVIHTKDGKPALTYKALDGAPKEYVFKRGKPSKEVGKHYMADALLANWDFAGMTDDNIMWDPEGNPFRVDQGGTFEYKAMGGPKPYGPVPTEVWTMIQKGQAKRASDVTEDEMREQALEIEAILDGPTIDALVDAAPFKNTDMKERIRENMKARVAWMGAFGRGEVDLPRPLTGEDARDAFTEAQDGFQVYPKEQEALTAYVGGEGFGINEVLKKGGEWTPEQKKTIKALDEVLKASKTTEDMHLYIGVDLPLADLPPEMAGKTLGDAGFAHATTDIDVASESQGVIKLLLPAGSKALYLPDLLPGHAGAEPEVIMPRGSRLKLEGVKDGQLTATLLPPAPPKWGPPPKSSYKSKPGAYSGPSSSTSKPAQSSIWDDVDDGVTKKNPGTGPPAVGETLSAGELYHVAPVDDRASVWAHGLDTERRDQSRDWRDLESDYEDFPLGNYFTSDLARAREYAKASGGEIWTVDTEDLDLRPDPDPQWKGVGFYTPDTVGRDRLRGLVPPPKMNPGTINAPGDWIEDEGGNIIADPRAAKGGISIPHFNTPDPKARQENIDAAKSLRDLYLADDVAGLKAFKVNPKAKKLVAFRYELISKKLGPKPGTEPKPSSKPKPSSGPSSPDNPEMEAEIADKQTALEQDFGISFLPGKGAGRIRSKGWLNILNTVRPEIEQMEARWPGVTKGVKLTRQMPSAGIFGGSPLGVFDTGSVGDIKLVPSSKMGNSAPNKHGIPFSVGGGDLGTVFRHEFAHHRDWQTQAKYRDAIKQTRFTDDDGNQISPKKWGKRHISQYSGTMTSEFIAEAWALYTSPGYDGSMGKRMDAIMEAFGTGGEPPDPELAEIVGGHIV